MLSIFYLYSIALYFSCFIGSSGGYGKVNQHTQDFMQESVMAVDLRLCIYIKQLFGVLDNEYLKYIWIYTKTD